MARLSFLGQLVLLAAAALLDGSLAQTNVALGKPADQKDTFAAPSRAVDGNTNGDWNQGSVTHTLTGNDAWWTVYLLGMYEMESVKIYNRMDAASERLSFARVELLDSRGTVVNTQLLGDMTGVAQVTLTFPDGARAAQVKITSANSNILSLAEVQVFGNLVRYAGTEYDLYAPPVSSCPVGLEVTNLADCKAAGLAAGGRERTTGTQLIDGVVTGQWSHTPCGCFLWLGTKDIHFDFSPQCSGSDGDNQGVLCQQPPPPLQAAGAGGDPHFRTWSGNRYDFHGHCDLLLLKSPHFGQGQQKHPKDQGLSVHIRSAPFKMVYSYISDIAIQIGDDVLEIGSEGKHYINGVPQQIGATHPVGGYPILSMMTKNGRHVFRVHLGLDREKQYHGQELTIREYKDWITIGVHHPSPEDFADSIGLMGSYPQGTWLGRDGVTLHTEIDDFGSDWIVHEDIDGNLFQEPSPFPDKCNLPSLEDTKRRRLSTSTITREEALEVCAKWVSPEAMEDCVMDVLVADDLEMAANL